MAGWAAYAKHRDIFKSNLAICLKRQVYNSCVLLWHMVQRPGHWPNKHRTNLRPHRPKSRRLLLHVRLLSFITKLIDIIYTVRKMKWSWAGHINRLKDDRWTSRVTTWRPYDKKRRQGRPAKRWRDDLDKYWSDTIWQRTAQDRVIWRRHAEAFAQPRDTRRLVLHVRLLSFITYYIDHQDVWCFMWGYSPSSHIILIIKTFGASCEVALLHHILYWSSILLVLHVRLLSFNIVLIHIVRCVTRCLLIPHDNVLVNSCGHNRHTYPIHCHYILLICMAGNVVFVVSFS